MLAGENCTIAVDVTSNDANVYPNETSPIQSLETGLGETAQATLIVADVLAVHKQFLPDRIREGETSSLIITIFNPGITAAQLVADVTNVSLVDTLPPGLRIVNATTLTDVCNGGVLIETPTSFSLTGGALLGGEYCTFSMTVEGKKGTYPNTTEAVSSEETGPTVPSNTAVLVIRARPIAEAIGLSVTDPASLKSVSPESATVGETVTWTIRVTNPGSIPITPTIVSDPIPSVLTILDAYASQGTVTITGQNVVANLGTLNPGDTAIITILSVGNDSAPVGEICNIAYSGTVMSEACMLLAPEKLPNTGGRPFGTMPPALILGGIAALMALFAVVKSGVLRRIDW
jgi:uncharacterized repeat protein (TIGR01451 family)